MLDRHSAPANDKSAKNLINHELSRDFVIADSSHDFFRRAESTLRRYKSRFSYADIARKAEFSSRSYVRALFLGKRKPSLSAVQKIAQGLGFDKNLERGLSLLAQAESSHAKGKEQKYRRELETIRERIRRRIERREERSQDGGVFRLLDWPYVFACLRGPGNPVPIDRIAKGANLPENTCRTILQQMEAMDIVKSFNDGTYESRIDFLNFSLLGGSGEFGRFYHNLLGRVRSEVLNRLNDRETLFHCSVIPVATEDLPRMRDEIQAIMDRYASENCNDDGDRIVTIQTTMLPR